MHNLPAYILFLLTGAGFAGLFAGCTQKVRPLNEGKPVPALLVVIVVDQLKSEYLVQWSSEWKYGFRRLLQNGVVFLNAHHPHAPTQTAPGHASISTGLPPSWHGIPANFWFDRSHHRIVYAVEDTRPGTLWGNLSLSPHFLNAPTAGDWLKTLTRGRGRVACVALKDRSALLLCGRNADIAIWWDPDPGIWNTWKGYPHASLLDQMRNISLSRLLSELPDTWHFRPVPWMVPPPISSSDSTVYEKSPLEGKIQFPYVGLRGQLASAPRLLMYLPAGISETFRRARELIRLLEMGTDDIPDLLMISISTTDYLAHDFSPHSWEILSIYRILDSLLGVWMDWLDQTVGGNRYLIVLTSDHGAAWNAQYTRERLHLPCQYIPYETQDSLRQFVNRWARKQFQLDSLVIAVVNLQMYLNISRIQTLPRNQRKKMLMSLRELLLSRYSWLKTVTIFVEDFPEDQTWIPASIRRGYVPGRSGDIWLIPSPCSYLYHSERGTTHGTPWMYDRQVPILIYDPWLEASQKLYWDSVSVYGIAPYLLFRAGFLPQAYTPWSFELLQKLNPPIPWNSRLE